MASNRAKSELCGMLFSVIVSTMLATTNGLSFHEEESNLRERLFGSNASTSIGYNNRVRPTDSTQVTMTLVLLSLVDLDIELQEMSVTALAHTLWQDERLVWNENDYGGIDAISVDVNEVWYPPILFLNAVSDFNFAGTNKIPFRVKSDGNVTWASPVNLKTSCDMKVVYFPFDTQRCSIAVYPYSFSKQEVQIVNLTTKDSVSLQYYTENAAWVYVSHSSSSTFFSDQDLSYTGMKFYLTFKRRWLYLTVSIILPTILNLLLMLGVFMLHVDSGEKMGYSLTVLLSYIVLLTIVSDQLPNVSTQVCILQIYLAIVLVVGALSTLLSIWVININNRDDQKTPISAKTKNIVKFVAFPLIGFAFWRALFARSCPQCTNTATAKQNQKNAGHVESQTRSQSHSAIRDKNRLVLDQETPQLTSVTSTSTLTTSLSTRSSPKSNKIRIKKSNSISPVDSGIKNTSINNTTPSPSMLKTTSPSHQTPNTPLISPSALRDAPSLHSDDDADSKPQPPVASPNNDSSTIVSSQNYSKIANTQSELGQQEVVTSVSDTHPSHSCPVSNLGAMLDQLTWKDVALVVDSFLLRILGGGLTIFTISLFLPIYLQYS